MTDEAKDDAAIINAEDEGAANSNETSEEGTVDIAAELEKERKARIQITARAKKAEEELKALKAKPQEQTNDSPLSDELKLIARGLSDEEIEQAKVIAKGKGIALTEAIKDPLFTIYQGDLKDKERKEKAKLGASHGSGESPEEITGTESGSTREDHIKAFKKIVGKK